VGGGGGERDYPPPVNSLEFLISDRFVVHRVTPGIPKRVYSLCFRALSEILSLFLGGDV